MNKKQKTEEESQKSKNTECENAVSLRHGLYPRTKTEQEKRDKMFKAQLREIDNSFIFGDYQNKYKNDIKGGKNKRKIFPNFNPISLFKRFLNIF